MIQKNFMLIILLVLIISNVHSQEKIVELPSADFANTQTLEIARVTLSDTATVLDIEAYFRPGFWIKVVSDSYLKTDDAKYIIRSGQGIDLDSLFWMPQTGRASFKLVFDPLPKNTKSFDFIESDCSDCFKIYGVNLMNEKSKLSGIPAKFKHKHQHESDFEVTLNEGVATVKGQFLGYHPELGKVNITYFNPIVGNVDEQELLVNADGTFTANVGVVSPSAIDITTAIYQTSLIVAPGKTSEVLINLPELHRKKSQLLKDKSSLSKECYYAGYLAALNADMLQTNPINIRDSDFNDRIADMDFNSYKTFVMERYRNAVNANNKLNITPLAKKIANFSHSIELQNMLNFADGYITEAYAQKHGISYEEALKKINLGKKEDGYNDYYHLISYNDSEMLLTSGVSGFIRRLMYAHDILSDPYIIFRYLTKSDKVASEDQAQFQQYLTSLENDAHTTSNTHMDSLFQKYNELIADYAESLSGIGFLKKMGAKEGDVLISLINSQKISEGLKDYTPLTEEQKQQIESYAPSIRSALFNENEKLLAKIEENKLKTGYTILTNPKTEDESLLVEMFEPFKGKVVLVDVWATWCGPCRMAHKDMEPLKAQFADKDVIFLYLAGENSPENTWLNLIADIHGSHYRLNQRQWDYLNKSLNVRGVPTYVVLDREGNQSYYATGFPGVEQIKQKLNKALEK